jgi:hypothetical protein
MLDGNTDQQKKADTQDAVPEWINTLPEDVRTPENIPTLKKYKDVGSISKAYIEAQKKIGQKGVLIPGENATDEERNNFYKSLGRPDYPEGYDFKKPEKLPDNVTWNEDRVKKFAGVFHKLGIPKTQANEILNAYNQDVFEEVAGQQKAINEFREKSVADLKKEWGSNFDKNIQKANAAVKLFGGRELIDLLKNTGMDAHPVLVKVFEKIASRIGENSLVDGYVETQKPVLTKAKLEQMMKDTRYCGREYERDSEYIEQIKKGWQALTAGEANAG